MLDIIVLILAIIGIISLINNLLRALSSFIDSIDKLYTKMQIKLYYPIIVRINKRKHKEYIEKYFNNLLFKKSGELFEELRGVRIEWSDEEDVEIDLEENKVLVRIKYADKLEDVLARAALMIAPYFVSKHLEPMLGEEFSRVISIGMVERILSDHPHILKKFRELVDKLYGENSEFRELLGLIAKADDTSLYTHVFLYEVKSILGWFKYGVNREKLVSELKDLLRMLANLENTQVPMICGYYVCLTVVRVGKLEKVVLGEWERYTRYVEECMKQCPRLKHVYVVSAGSTVLKIIEDLLDYIVKNIPNIRLIDRTRYKARYYKGKPYVPSYIAVLEIG